MVGAMMLPALVFSLLFIAVAVFIRREQLKADKLSAPEVFSDDDPEEKARIWNSRVIQDFIKGRY